MVTSARPRVFVSRLIPDAGLDPIRAACDADIWTADLPPSRAELLRKVRGCDGLLVLLSERIDDELLDHAGPGLKVVSDFAVGYDNIDVAACARRGVAVGNTPGVLTETTADLAWALILGASRRVGEGDRTVRAREWRTWGPQTLLGQDVHGATLGVIGFGRIGQAVARRAIGFGMPVVYHSRHRVPEEVERALGARYLPLEELLATSDIVSINCALTAETRGLIDAAALGRMKSTAVAGQHRPRPDRGPGGAGGRVARRGHRCRRAGRDGPRADPPRRPAAGPRQLPDRAAHRVGDDRDPGPDGRDGGREPSRGGARGAAPDPGHAAWTRVARAAGWAAPCEAVATVGYALPWAGSSVAEQGTFNPWVEGSNPSRLAVPDRSGGDGPMALLILAAMVIPIALVYIGVISWLPAMVAVFVILFAAAWDFDRRRRPGAPGPTWDAAHPDFAAPMDGHQADPDPGRRGSRTAKPPGTTRMSVPRRPIRA